MRSSIPFFRATNPPIKISKKGYMFVPLNIPITIPITASSKVPLLQAAGGIYNSHEHNPVIANLILKLLL